MFHNSKSVMKDSNVSSFIERMKLTRNKKNELEDFKQVRKYSIFNNYDSNSSTFMKSFYNISHVKSNSLYNKTPCSCRNRNNSSNMNNSINNVSIITNNNYINDISSINNYTRINPIKSSFDNESNIEHKRVKVLLNDVKKVLHERLHYNSEDSS